jgi:hypothetical protein
MLRHVRYIGRRKVMKHLTILCAALFLVALALGGCAASSTQGPMAWLDEPLDGAALPLEPTEIMAHASDADGVTSGVESEQVGRLNHRRQSDR